MSLRQVCTTSIRLTTSVAFTNQVSYTGGGVGGVVFPLMLQSLFEKVGWGWSIRILGLISFLLAGIASFLLKSRLPPAHNASIHPDFRIFKNIPFLLTTIGIFLLEFGLFIPLTYISLYASSHGFAEAFSFQILTVLNSASVLGRVLPGWYSDKLGVFNANIIAVLISIVSALAVWWPAGPSTAGLVIFALLFGFASGTNISLCSVCIGKLCRIQNYGRY